MLSYNSILYQIHTIFSHIQHTPFPPKSAPPEVYVCIRGETNFLPGIEATALIPIPQCSSCGITIRLLMEPIDLMTYCSLFHRY